LKGVAPAIPFSDAAFRRYYDHALAYKDFKEASKSEDKHRLYLGLLGGLLPGYPDAVLYHYRERLLDQAEDLCVEMDKPLIDCEVGPLLPPIQTDPFEADEVRRLFLFTLRSSAK
jgi:hypothetical protein